MFERSKRWEIRPTCCGAFFALETCRDNSSAIIQLWPTPGPFQPALPFSAGPSAKASPRPSAAKASMYGTPTATVISTSPAPLPSTSSDTACPKFPPPWPNRPRSSSSFTPASSLPRSPKSMPRNCWRSPEKTSATGEVFSGERQQFLGILFGDRGSELAGVNELELRGLFGHGGGNFGHAVSDEVDGSGAGEVEITVAVGVPYIDAFAADGRGEAFAEGPAENGRAGWNGPGVGHN